MERRERRDYEVGTRQPEGGEGGGNLSEIRQEAGRLLDVGDDAIQRALSGDSERFLEAGHQQGGQ